MLTLTIKAELEPQAHACALICPGHHVDLFLWICKGRYSLVLYPLDLPCRLHTNCHPCTGDTWQSLPAFVGFFFCKYSLKFFYMIIH